MSSWGSTLARASFLILYKTLDNWCMTDIFLLSHSLFFYSANYAYSILRCFVSNVWHWFGFQLYCSSSVPKAFLLWSHVGSVRQQRLLQLTTRWTEWNWARVDGHLLCFVAPRRLDFPFLEQDIATLVTSRLWLAWRLGSWTDRHHMDWPEIRANFYLNSSMLLR